MAKVKIVQIAYMGDEPTEYLDDQGRIWWDNGRSVVDEERSVRGEDSVRNPTYTVKVMKWEQDWEQLNLPDEPTV